MNFFQSIKTVFRKYAEFRGRATRAEFWWFALFVAVVSAGLSALNVWFGGRMIEVGLTANSVFGYVSFAFLWGLVTLLPTLAVSVRRLHDAGRKGEELFWLLVPIIGWVTVIVRLCHPSVPVTDPLRETQD